MPARPRSRRAGVRAGTSAAHLLTTTGRGGRCLRTAGPVPRAAAVGPSVGSHHTRHSAIARCVAGSGTRLP
ncbi:hypothetical protein [Ornithinimicrobium kibberense]|uniref:hypothetical protein n=1 Tax=Ornithinimicrobium kibberense TaxID=282060 RepID=UPI003620B7CF